MALNLARCLDMLFRIWQRTWTSIFLVNTSKHLFFPLIHCPASCVFLCVVWINPCGFLSHLDRSGHYKIISQIKLNSTFLKNRVSRSVAPFFAVHHVFLNAFCINKPFRFLSFLDRCDYYKLFLQKRPAKNLQNFSCCPIPWKMSIIRVKMQHESE